MLKSHYNKNTVALIYFYYLESHSFKNVLKDFVIEREFYASRTEYEDFKDFIHANRRGKKDIDTIE